MRHRQDVRLLMLGVAGLLAGIAVAWAASFGSYRPMLIPGTAVGLLVGWSFIASGLASWRARPENRLGPVMVGTGFAWFASLLQQANGPVLFTIGEAFQVCYLAGFLYVVLSFPSGRLRGALDRALVWVTIGLVTVVQLAMLMFAESRAFICEACSANLLEVTDNSVVAYGVLQFQRTAGLVVMIGTIGLLATRLVRASQPQRRQVTPVLLAGIVAATVLVTAVTADVFNLRSSLVLTRIVGYALAAVPLAVLVAFAQRRLARGAVAGLVVELGAPQSALDLREALSRALGDPSLKLGYWFAAESRFVDNAGHPSTFPAPTRNVSPPWSSGTASLSPC